VAAATTPAPLPASESDDQAHNTDSGSTIPGDRPEFPLPTLSNRHNFLTAPPGIDRPRTPPELSFEDSRALLTRLTGLQPWQLEAFPDELPPLPLSRPSSPLRSTEVTRPTAPVRERRLSTTAVPIRFRKPPGSPNAESEAPVTLNTSPLRPRHGKAPSAEFKSSREFRPLYLLERKRKSEEIDESLPALPASGSPSRTSSATETDGEYESALESPMGASLTAEHGFFMPLDALTSQLGPQLQQPELADREIEEVDESGQVTPKASEFRSAEVGPERDVLAAALEDVRAKSDKSASSRPTTPLAPSAQFDETKMRDAPAQRSRDASPAMASSSRLQTAALGAAIGGLTAAALRTRSPSPTTERSANVVTDASEMQTSDVPEPKGKAKSKKRPKAKKDSISNAPIEGTIDPKQYIPTFVDNEDDWAKNKSESVVTDDATLVGEPVASSSMLKAMRTEKVLESTAPQGRDSIEVMRATLDDKERSEDVLPQTLTEEKSVVAAPRKQDAILPTEEEAASTSAKGKKAKKNKKGKRGSQQLESELANLPEQPPKEDEILPAPETQRSTVEREILEPAFPDVREEKTDVVEGREPTESRDVASVPALQQEAVVRQVLEPAFAKDEKKVNALDFLVANEPTATTEQIPEPAANVETAKALLPEQPSTVATEIVEQPKEAEPEPVKSTWGTGLLGALGWGKKRATSPTPTPAPAPEIKKAVEEQKEVGVPPAAIIAVEEKQVKPETEVIAPAVPEAIKESSTHLETTPVNEASRDIVDDTPIPRSSFVAPQTAYFTDGGKPSFTFPAPSTASAQAPSNDQTLDRELPERSNDVSTAEESTHLAIPPRNAVFTDDGKPSFPFPAFSTARIAPVLAADEEALKDAPSTPLPDTRTDVPTLDNPTQPESLPVDDAAAEATSSKKKKAKKDKKKRGSIVAPEAIEAEPLSVMDEPREVPATDEVPVLVREAERPIEEVITKELAPENIALPDGLDELDEPVLPVVDTEPVRQIPMESMSKDQQPEIIRDTLELPKETSPIDTSIVTEAGTPIVVAPIEEDASSSTKKKGKKAKKAKRGSMQVDESEPSTPTVERSLDLSLPEPTEAVLDVGVDVPLPSESVQEKEELADIPEILPTFDQPAPVQDRALDLAAVAQDVPVENPTMTEELLLPAQPELVSVAPIKKKGKKKAKSGTQTPDIQGEAVLDSPAPLSVVSNAPKEAKLASQPLEAQAADTVLFGGPTEQEKVLDAESASVQPLVEQPDTPVSKKKKKAKKVKGTETPVETEVETSVQPAIVKTEVGTVRDDDVKPENVKLPDNDLEGELEPIAIAPAVAEIAQPENLQLPDAETNDELESTREVAMLEPRPVAIDAPVSAAVSEPATTDSVPSFLESAPVGPQLQGTPTAEEQATQADVPVVEDEQATTGSAKKDKKKKKGKKNKVADESESGAPVAEVRREVEGLAESAGVRSTVVESTIDEPTVVEPTVNEPIMDVQSASALESTHPEAAIEATLPVPESAVEVPTATRDLPTADQLPSQPTADAPAPIEESLQLATPIEDESAATSKKSKKKKTKKGKSVDETFVTDNTETPSIAPELAIEAVSEEPKDIALPLETPKELAPAPVDEASEVALPIEIAGELDDESAPPAEILPEPVEAVKSENDAPIPVTDEPTRDVVEEEPASTSKKSKKKKGKKAVEIGTALDDALPIDPINATSIDASKPTTTEARAAPLSDPIISTPIVEPAFAAPIDKPKDVALPIETAEDLASVSIEPSRELVADAITDAAVAEPSADAIVPVSRDLAEQVADEEPLSTPKKSKKKKGKKATEVLEPAAEVAPFSEPTIATPVVESEAAVAIDEPKDIALPVETADELIDESQKPPLPAEISNELVAQPVEDTVVSADRDIPEPIVDEEPVSTVKKSKKKKGKKTKGDDAEAETIEAATANTAVEPVFVEPAVDTTAVEPTLPEPTVVEPSTDVVSALTLEAALDTPLPTSDPTETALPEPTEGEKTLADAVASAPTTPSREVTEPTVEVEPATTSNKSKKKKGKKGLAPDTEPSTPVTEESAPQFPVPSESTDVDKSVADVVETSQQDLSTVFPTASTDVERTIEPVHVETPIAITPVPATEELTQDTSVSTAIEPTLETEGAEGTSKKTKKKKSKKGKSVDITEPSTPVTEEPAMQFGTPSEPAQMAKSIDEAARPLVEEPVLEVSKALLDNDPVSEPAMPDKVEDAITLPVVDESAADVPEPSTPKEQPVEDESAELTSKKSKKKKGKKSKTSEDVEPEATIELGKDVASVETTPVVEEIKEATQPVELLQVEPVVETAAIHNAPIPDTPIERELATEITHLSEPVDFEVPMDVPVVVDQSLPEAPASTEPKAPAENEDAASTSKKGKKKKSKKTKSESEPQTPVTEVDSFLAAAPQEEPTTKDNVVAEPASSLPEEPAEEPVVPAIVPEPLSRALEDPLAETTAADPIDSTPIIEQSSPDKDVATVIPEAVAEAVDEQVASPPAAKKDKKKGKKSKRVSIAEEATAIPVAHGEEGARELGSQESAAAVPLPEDSTVSETAKEIESQESAATVPLPEDSTISEPVSPRTVLVDTAVVESAIRTTKLDQDDVPQAPLAGQNERSLDAQEAPVLPAESVVTDPEPTQLTEDATAPKKSKKKSKKTKSVSIAESEPLTPLKTSAPDVESASLDAQPALAPELIAESKNDAVSTSVDVQPIASTPVLEELAVEASQEQQPIVETPIVEEPQQIVQDEEAPISKADKKKAKKNKRVSIAEPSPTPATPVEEKEITLDEQSLPVAQLQEPAQDEAVSSAIDVQPIATSEIVAEPKQEPESITDAQPTPEEDASTTSKKDKKKAKKAKRVSIAEPESAPATPSEEKKELELPLEEVVVVAPAEQTPDIVPVEEPVPAEPTSEILLAEQPVVKDLPIAEPSAVVQEDVAVDKKDKKKSKKAKRGSVAESGTSTPVEEKALNPLDAQQLPETPVVDEQARETPAMDETVTDTAPVVEEVAKNEEVVEAPVEAAVSSNQGIDAVSVPEQGAARATPDDASKAPILATEESLKDAPEDESAAPVSKKDKKKSKKAKRGSVVEPELSEPSPAIIAPSGLQPDVSLSQTEDTVPAEPSAPAEPSSEQTKEILVEDLPPASLPTSEEPVVVAAEDIALPSTPAATDDTPKDLKDDTPIFVSKQDKKKAKKSKRGSIAEPEVSEPSTVPGEAVEKVPDAIVEDVPPSIVQDATVLPAVTDEAATPATEHRDAPTATTVERKESNVIADTIEAPAEPPDKSPSIDTPITVESQPLAEERKDVEESSILSKSQKKKGKKAKRVSVPDAETSLPATAAEESAKELVLESEAPGPDVLSEPIVVERQPEEPAVVHAPVEHVPVVQEVPSEQTVVEDLLTVPSAVQVPSIEPTPTVEDSAPTSKKDKKKSKKAKRGSVVDDPVSQPATPAEEVFKELVADSTPVIEEPPVDAPSSSQAPVDPTSTPPPSSKKDKKKKAKSNKAEPVPFLALETPEEANVSDTQPSPHPSIPSETNLLLSGIPTSYPHVRDGAFVANDDGEEKMENEAEVVQPVAASEAVEELERKVQVGPLEEMVDDEKKSKKNKKGKKRASVIEEPVVEEPAVEALTSAAEASVGEPLIAERVEAVVDAPQPKDVLLDQPTTQVEVTEAQIPHTRSIEESKYGTEESTAPVPTESEQKKVKKHKLASMFEQNAAQDAPELSRKHTPLVEPATVGESSNNDKSSEDVAVVIPESGVGVEESVKEGSEVVAPKDIPLPQDDISPQDVALPMEHAAPQDVPLPVDDTAPQDVPLPQDAAVDAPVATVETTDKVPEAMDERTTSVTETHPSSEITPDIESSMLTKKDKKKSKKSKKQSGTATPVELIPEVQSTPLEDVPKVGTEEQQAAPSVEREVPVKVQQVKDVAPEQLKIAPDQPRETVDVVPELPQDESTISKDISAPETVDVADVDNAPSKKDKKKSKKAKKQSESATPAEEAAPEIQQDIVGDVAPVQLEPSITETASTNAPVLMEPETQAEEAPLSTTTDKAIEGLQEVDIPVAVEPIVQVPQEQVTQTAEEPLPEATPVAEDEADSIVKASKKEKKKGKKAKKQSDTVTLVTEDVPELEVKKSVEVPFEQHHGIDPEHVAEPESITEDTVEVLSEAVQPASIEKTEETLQHPDALPVALDAMSEVNNTTQAGPDAAVEPSQPAEEDWGYTPPKKDKKMSKKEKKADTVSSAVELAPEISSQQEEPIATPAVDPIDQPFEPTNRDLTLDNATVDMTRGKSLPEEVVPVAPTEDILVKELEGDRASDAIAIDIAKATPLPTATLEDETIDPVAALEEDTSALTSKKDKKKSKKSKKASGTATPLTEDIPIVQPEVTQESVPLETDVNDQLVKETIATSAPEERIAEDLKIEPTEPTATPVTDATLLVDDSTPVTSSTKKSKKKSKKSGTATPATEELLVPQPEIFQVPESDTTDKKEVAIDSTPVLDTQELPLVEESREIQQPFLDPAPVIEQELAQDELESPSVAKQKSKKKAKKSDNATPITEDVPMPVAEMTRDLEAEAKPDPVPTSEPVATNEKEILMEDPPITAAPVEVITEDRNTEQFETPKAPTETEIESQIAEESLSSLSKKNKKKAKKSGTATPVVNDVVGPQLDVQEPEVAAIPKKDLLPVSEMHTEVVAEPSQHQQHETPITPALTESEPPLGESASPSASTKKSKKKGKKPETATPVVEDVAQEILPIDDEVAATREVAQAPIEQLVEEPFVPKVLAVTTESTQAAEPEAIAPISELVEEPIKHEIPAATELIVGNKPESEPVLSTEQPTRIEPSNEEFAAGEQPLEAAPEVKKKKGKKSKGKKSEPQTPTIERSDPIDFETPAVPEQRQEELLTKTEAQAPIPEVVASDVVVPSTTAEEAVVDREKPAAIFDNEQVAESKIPLVKEVVGSLPVVEPTLVEEPQQISVPTVGVTGDLTPAPIETQAEEVSPASKKGKKNKKSKKQSVTLDTVDDTASKFSELSGQAQDDNTPLVEREIDQVTGPVETEAESTLTHSEALTLPTTSDVADMASPEVPAPTSTVDAPTLPVQDFTEHRLEQATAPEASEFFAQSPVMEASDLTVPRGLELVEDTTPLDRKASKKSKKGKQAKEVSAPAIESESLELPFVTEPATEATTLEPSSEIMELDAPTSLDTIDLPAYEAVNKPIIQPLDTENASGPSTLETLGEDPVESKAPEIVEVIDEGNAWGSALIKKSKKAKKSKSAASVDTPAEVIPEPAIVPQTATSEHVESTISEELPREVQLDEPKVSVSERSSDAQILPDNSSAPVIEASQEAVKSAQEQPIDVDDSELPLSRSASKKGKKKKDKKGQKAVDDLESETLESATPLTETAPVIAPELPLHQSEILPTITEAKIEAGRAPSPPAFQLAEESKEAIPELTTVPTQSSPLEVSRDITEPAFERDVKEASHQPFVALSPELQAVLDEAADLKLRSEALDQALATKEFLETPAPSEPTSFFDVVGKLDKKNKKKGKKAKGVAFDSEPATPAAQIDAVVETKAIVEERPMVEDSTSAELPTGNAGENEKKKSEKAALSVETEEPVIEQSRDVANVAVEPTLQPEVPVASIEEVAPTSSEQPATAVEGTAPVVSTDAHELLADELPVLSRKLSKKDKKKAKKEPQFDDAPVLESEPAIEPQIISVEPTPDVREPVVSVELLPVVAEPTATRAMHPEVQKAVTEEDRPTMSRKLSKKDKKKAKQGTSVLDEPIYSMEEPTNTPFEQKTATNDVTVEDAVQQDRAPAPVVLSEQVDRQPSSLFSERETLTTDSKTTPPGVVTESRSEQHHVPQVEEMAQPTPSYTAFEDNAPTTIDSADVTIDSVPNTQNDDDLNVASAVTRKQSKKDKKKGKKNALAGDVIEQETAKVVEIEDTPLAVNIPEQSLPSVEMATPTASDMQAKPTQETARTTTLEELPTSTPADFISQPLDLSRNIRDESAVAEVSAREVQAEAALESSQAKKQKRKSKTATAFQEEPIEETQSSTPRELIVEPSMAQEPTFATLPEIQAEDDWALSSKKSKKEKRDSKKTVTVDEQEPVTSLELEMHHSEVIQGQPEQLVVAAPVAEASNEVHHMTPAPVKFTKTAVQSAPVDALEAPQQPTLARKTSKAHKLAAMFEQGASQGSSAAQRELRKGGSGSVKNLAEQFETQSRSVTPITLPTSEKRSISRAPSNAHLRTESPKNIDFAGTIAAGLKISGFDDKYVVDDSTFHRVTTPGGVHDITPDEDVAAAMNSASASKFATRGWTTPTSSPKLQPTREADSNTLPPIEVAMASTDAASFDPLDVLNDPAFTKRTISPGVLEEADPEELGSKLKMNKKPKGKKKRVSVPDSPMDVAVTEATSTAPTDEYSDTTTRGIAPEMIHAQESAVHEINPVDKPRAVPAQPIPFEEVQEDSWSATPITKSKKVKKDKKRASDTQESVEYATVQTPVVEDPIVEPPTVETLVDSTTRATKLQHSLPSTSVNVAPLERSLPNDEASAPTAGKELGEYPFPEVSLLEKITNRNVEEKSKVLGQEEVEEQAVASKKKSKKSRKGKEKDEGVTSLESEQIGEISIDMDQKPAHDTHKRRSHPVTFAEDQPYEKRAHLEEPISETASAPKVTATEHTVREVTSSPKETRRLGAQPTERAHGPTVEPSWSFAGVRDSAVEVADSPVQSSAPSFQETIRDSGYHDSDYNPIIQHEELPQVEAPTHERKRRSKDPKTSRQKAVRDVQDADSPSLPPVATPDYATKERTSYLFDSSPSTRALGASPAVEPITPAHESRRTSHPLAYESRDTTEVKSKPLVESQQEQVSESKAVTQAEPYQSIFGDPNDPSSGPSASAATPASKHRRTPSNKQLHTITEASPDDSPLHKKGRSINDIGAPDRGTKSLRRTDSSKSFSERMKSPPPVTPTPSSRKSMPSAAGTSDKKSPVTPWQQVNEHVDRSMTLSPARRMPRSSPSFDPIKQHMAEQRSPSALSQRSMSNISKLRSPDQDRPLSSASNRSTQSLRRIDRSASGDLRANARLGEVSARDASDMEPNLSDLALAAGATAAIAGIAAASKYDPVRGAGKGRRASMVAESFVSV
jgi:hypothetical protein